MRTILAALLAVILGGCCTKMAEVPEPKTLPTPEFGRIRQEAGRATEDAIRLIWLGVNANLRSAQRLNLRLRQQQEAFESLFNWQDRAFDANEFDASTGTWTVESGDFLFYRTLVIQDLAHAWVAVETTTVANSPSALRIALPFTISAPTAATGQVVGGTITSYAIAGDIQSTVEAADDGLGNWFLILHRSDGTALYPNETNGVRVSVIATMKIVP